MRLGMSSPHFTAAEITLENDVTGPSECDKPIINATTASECGELGQV